MIAGTPIPLYTIIPLENPTMLGLHNVFLCSSNISPSIQQDHNSSSNNNNRNGGVLSDSSFWGLNKPQEQSQDDGNNNYGGSMKVCRDCGNRAKKGCSYTRCRTCCKSRGYDCATHVRSTWIPASKRREKKGAAVAGGRGIGGGGGSSGSSSCGVKRTRGVVDSSQNLTPSAAAATSNSLSFDTACFHQDASFKRTLPGQVEAPAVFRCIRVTAINEDEAEVAYVATVNISGHVFKGFLYHKGVDEKNLFQRIPNPQLETSTSGRNQDSSSPIIHQPNAYVDASSN